MKEIFFENGAVADPTLVENLRDDYVMTILKRTAQDSFIF